MAQAETPVSKTPETVRVETVKLDEARLRRDVVTYYRRITASKGEAARLHNLNTFLERKRALEQLGLRVIEQNGTIITIDPRKN